MRCFPIKFIKHVDLTDLFSHVADEKVYIVLGNFMAAMSKQFREGDDISAINDPLLCNGMVVSEPFLRLAFLTKNKLDTSLRKTLKMMCPTFYSVNS